MATNLTPNARNPSAATGALPSGLVYAVSGTNVKVQGMPLEASAVQQRTVQVEAYNKTSAGAGFSMQVNAAVPRWAPTPDAEPALRAAYGGGYYMGVTTEAQTTTATKINAAPAIGSGVALTIAHDQTVTPLFYEGQRIEVCSTDGTTKIVGTAKTATGTLLGIEVTEVSGTNWATTALWYIRTRVRNIIAPKANGVSIPGNQIVTGMGNAATTTILRSQVDGKWMAKTMRDQNLATAAVAQVMALTIGGFNDWYVPAWGQFELYGRHCMPSTGRVGPSSFPSLVAQDAPAAVLGTPYVPNNGLQNTNSVPVGGAWNAGSFSPPPTFVGNGTIWSYAGAQCIDQGYHATASLLTTVNGLAFYFEYNRNFPEFSRWLFQGTATAATVCRPWRTVPH